MIGIKKHDIKHHALECRLQNTALLDIIRNSNLIRELSIATNTYHHAIMKLTHNGHKCVRAAQIGHVNMIGHRLSLDKESKDFFKSTKGVKTTTTCIFLM